MENGIHNKMPEDWDGTERRSTCTIHHDTIQEIYNKLVSWKVFVLVVGLAAGVVGGTNLLVQNSVKETKTEISAAFKDMKSEVKESNTVLHRRITEGNDERAMAIEKLNNVMNSVDRQLNILDYRMTQVEKKMEPSKK
jgi:uncharacterized protein HemX